MTEIMDKALRLIKAACGEDHYDGLIVTDVCEDYAEPGYRSKGCVVFGNWNNKRWVRDGDAPLTKPESLPSRLFDALEGIGVECEWLDEWTQCDVCYRALRTQANSYGWTMYGAFTDCGYTCADCMREDIETYLEDYINDPTKAVTWATSHDLIMAGYQPYSGVYENGWYPGQDDDPTKILDSIQGIHPEYDKVVFLINSVGQFDIRFEAYYKETEQ